MLAALLLTLATPKTVVLTYHDMVPRRDKNALWFDCTPAELESQIKYLKSRGATFVSLETLYRHLRNKRPIPNRAVAITFADNYEGFLRFAWPVLKRERVPVTMFVHTGHVGSRKNRPKMSWAQLRELSKDPLFRASSQTVSHPADLTKLTDAQIRKEFAVSKQSLEKNLPGSQSDFLAYPNGKFDARVAKIARESGYRMAFTEAQRPAQTGPDLWRVPRYVHTKYEKAWRDSN
jgi:poly-beta-1,6-N-acetyl-D-glucosamine N-deacetylase